MHQKFSLYIRILITVFMAVFLCFSSFAQVVQAKPQTNKTVRVAYAIYQGFQEGNEGEYKTGRGYEYLQKIAGYTGWTYEYVYGDFNTLLEKLKRGEVDLMGGLSYTNERAQVINYGHYEQGKDAYFLYVTASSDIHEEDLSTIQGKKIGVSDAVYNGLWNTWCEENDIECTLVHYATDEEAAVALNNGEIDGLIGSQIFEDNELVKGWHTVVEYGTAPYYFAVSNTRSDLLEELNYAQKKILDKNPYYNEELSSKYVHTGILSDGQPDEDALQWLSEHNNTIRVGCLDDYLPICDLSDKGEMKGVIPDLLAAIEENYKNYDVHFEPKIYNDYEQMLNDLREGTIDLATPIYEDYWNADLEDISLTDSFMSTTMLMLNAKGVSLDHVQSIAVDSSSPIQSVYARIYYKGYNIVSYPSMAEVALALKNGQVDIGLATACSYHILALLDDNVKELNRATLPETVSLAMGVNKSEPEVMTFMNQGIAGVGKTEIFNSLAENSNVSAPTTLLDYVYDHPLAALSFFGVIIIVLVLIILQLNRAMQKARKDSMTGLLNKNSMRSEVMKKMKEGGVLIMIDIDDFKHVNDVLGHKAGDVVISDFAKTLKTIFRKGDLIGRFGGDEFLVFLPDSVISEELLAHKIEQMGKTLDECEPLANSSIVHCTVSAGVLRVPKNSKMEYHEAFDLVDSALYKAKKSGKNTYVLAK